MVGQSHVLKALANAFDQDRLHHAYLFSGTRGVGKTTLARILAKCLNCDEGMSSAPCGKCSACTAIDEGRFVDLIEVDAASRAKVDETRELMENVQYAPTSGRYKVYLIDEIHMFSGHSFNALLKTLEEPPPHVKFLLATTEPKKLPVTILSRCLQFNLSHLTADQIQNQIDLILAEEQVEHDEGSVALIARGAAGSMRDALSLLDQAIAYGGGQLQESQVRAMMGTIDSADLLGLLQALVKHDAGTLLNIIQTVALQNPNFDGLLAEFMSVLQQIAIIQALTDADNPARQRTELIPFANMMRAEDVQLYYQIALKGRRDIYFAPDVKSGFEMTFIRMLAFRPLPTDEIPAATMPAPTAKNLRPAVTESASTGGEQELAKVKSGSKTEADSEATIAAENIAADQDWKTIVDEMALAGLVKQLADHCVLKSHTPDKVELSLSPSQQHLLNTRQETRLEQAIKLRFGEDVKLVMTVGNPSMETPTETKAQQSRERQQAAEQSVHGDKTVQALIDTFDATIDEDSIQPG